MSDVPAVPPLIGGLTPGEFASARASWIGAGLSAEQFDLQMTGSTAPVLSPVPSPAKPAPAYQADTFGSNLTPAQVATAVKSLTAAGVPADKIAEALAKDNLTMPEGDNRTDEQRSHDGNYNVAVYSPDQYQIAYPPHLKSLPLAELPLSIATVASSSPIST
jgi:hypothetical protein